MFYSLRSLFRKMSATPSYADKYHAGPGLAVIFLQRAMEKCVQGQTDAPNLLAVANVSLRNQDVAAQMLD
jgi:hypothetical protein